MNSIKMNTQRFIPDAIFIAIEKIIAINTRHLNTHAPLIMSAEIT